MGRSSRPRPGEVMRVAKTIFVAVVAGAILGVVALAPAGDVLRDTRGSLSRHGLRQQEQGTSRPDRRGRLSARRWQQHRDAQNRRKPWWFFSAAEDTPAMSATGPGEN